MNFRKGLVIVNMFEDVRTNNAIKSIIFNGQLFDVLHNICTARCDVSREKRCSPRFFHQPSNDRLGRKMQYAAIVKTNKTIFDCKSE